MCCHAPRNRSKEIQEGAHLSKPMLMRSTCESRCSYRIEKEVSEDGTGSRSPSQDVGDMGVPPKIQECRQ